MKEQAKQVIKNSIEMLKTLKKPSWYDQLITWTENAGYDADWDRAMKAYFKGLKPLADEELRQALVDIWGATVETLWHEPMDLSCCEPPKPEVPKKSLRLRAEEAVSEWLDKHNYKYSDIKCEELVKTNKGDRVAVEMKDGRKALVKPKEQEHEPLEPEVKLDFEATEKELLDLVEMGSHDYRSALAALVAKYNHSK